MGTLKYDGVSTEFEDHLLAHLQVVIVQKLGRGESFALTWLESRDHPGGQTTIWLHPMAMLSFHFSLPATLAIDPLRVDNLMLRANVTGGLVVSESQRILVSS